MQKNILLTILTDKLSESTQDSGDISTHPSLTANPNPNPAPNKTKTLDLNRG